MAPVTWGPRLPSSCLSCARRRPLPCPTRAKRDSKQRLPLARRARRPSGSCLAPFKQTCSWYGCALVHIFSHRCAHHVPVKGTLVAGPFNVAALSIIFSSLCQAGGICVTRPWTLSNLFNPLCLLLGAPRSLLMGCECQRGCSAAECSAPCAATCAAKGIDQRAFCAGECGTPVPGG